MALRVMVVDDALFMRNILKDIFVRHGYEVVAEAENGDTALQLYQESNPDLVTMDIVMPKKSGIEALQEIMAADPDAHVIMVSALGQDALVLEAVEAGARDFIVKPFKEDKVLETVRRVVGQD
ncbi:MAG: response regulator [Desulfuromonadales bacterium]|jgi:two-component system chemotaxis response regulator CheY